MNEQRRYDIRDAARLLGVAPSTLRYWEDQGIIRAERDPASRYRKYGLSALVDASEIVLFRSMGVPVKDLADYQRCTVGELDALLAETERGIDARLHELEAARAKIDEQRALCACAQELAQAGMRPGEPPFSQLLAVESDEQWFSLIFDVDRYAVYIAPGGKAVEAMAVWAEKGRRDAGRSAARRTGCAGEGSVVAAGDPAAVAVAAASASAAPSRVAGDVVWDAQRDRADCYRECLLACDKSQADWACCSAPLFDEARAQGCDPQYLVAHFLVSADCAGTRKDLYRAWIACSRP